MYLYVLRLSRVSRLAVIAPNQHDQSSMCNDSVMACYPLGTDFHEMALGYIVVTYEYAVPASGGFSILCSHTSLEVIVT